MNDFVNFFIETNTVSSMRYIYTYIKPTAKFGGSSIGRQGIVVAIQ